VLRRAARFAGAFLADVRLAAVFFAAPFFAGARLAAVFFAGAAFLAGAFLAAVFFAALFFAGARLAAVFFAAVFLAALFFWIWFSNMIGFLPLPTNTEHEITVFGLEIPAFAIYAATANISIPLVLTLVVWLSYHVEGIRTKGFVPYFASWLPPGLEEMSPFGKAAIFVIEVISHFVRLISLSVRLFANILAGHLLILFMGGGLVVLLNLAVGLSVILGLITGVMAVAFFLFEVGLVATLQAFIFATLTAIYLGGAVAEEH